MATTFVEYLRDELAPGWLRKPKAALFLEGFGLLLDELVTRAKDAVKQRFVLLCAPDALGYHGLERGLERFGIDTDATYRARLAIAWALWQLAGTAEGIVTLLAFAGFRTTAGVPIATVYSVLGGVPPGESSWPPDGDLANWSRFWVFLNATTASNTPFNWQATDWGGAFWGSGTWGGGADTIWGGWGVGTWGSSALTPEVDLTRRIPKTWKAAHEVLGGVVVDLPGGRRVRWGAS